VTIALGTGGQRRHHDGRAAHVGDGFFLDQPEDLARPDGAQADMGAADDRDRPGETPAVAVEHRQRPQIDWVVRHIVIFRWFQNPNSFRNQNLDHPFYL